MKGLPTSEPDLNWAAGLFEGEGTVTIAVRNQDSTYRLVCMVGNTDREIIDFFASRWGGWVQPAYGERPGRQPAWTWTVAGPRAEAFLREIEPHVRTIRVRNKIRLGLSLRAHQSRKTSVRKADADYKAKQRKLYLAMRSLNRRGVA